MNRGLRKIEAPDFSAGNKTSADLKKENIVSAYLLRALYDLTVSGGTGAGSPYADAAHRMASIIRLSAQVGGSTVPFVNVRGVTLGLIQELFLATAWPQNPPAEVESETGLYSQILIPLFMPRSLDPDEFAFAAPFVSGPLIEVTTANAADLFSGEDGTPSFDAGAEWELYELPLLNAVKNPKLYQGMLINYTEHTITGDESDKELRLPQLRIGDELVRVIVEAEADDAKNDSIITKIGLTVNGREVMDKVATAIYQGRNVTEYNLSAAKSGVVVFDFAEDQMTGKSQLETITAETGHNLTVDLSKQSGTNKVRITTMHVRGRI